MTETWGYEEINGLLEIDGYNLIKKHRKNRRGGGVLLLIRKNLNVNPIEKLNCNTLITEAVFCELKTNDKNILIGVVYRPPQFDQTMNNAVIELMSKLETLKFDDILLVGDFNLSSRTCFVNFDTYEHTEGFASTFLEKTQDLYLHQHVNFPTLHSAPGDKLPNDLIFTQNEELIKNLERVPPLGYSKHIGITFDIIIDSNVFCYSKPIEELNYWKGSYTEMNKEIEELDWTSILSSNDIDIDWSTFKETIVSVANKYLPKRKPPTSKPRRSQWITKKSIKAVKKKQALYKKVVKHGRFKDIDAYALARNQAVKACRQDKMNFEQNLVKSFKENPKKFYSHIKKQQKTNTDIPELNRTDGSRATSSNEKANTLNEFFKSVYVQENDQLIPIIEDKMPEDSCLTDIQFSEDDVRKLLIKLKPEKAPGPDQMHPKLLKECPSLAKPIYILFRRSLDSGILPREWKTSNVCPIFKKGSRADPGNYRPVALTSIICKMMETLVKNHINKHLSENDLICCEQHGFQHGRSCLTNLLEAFEDWTDAYDQGEQVDCIFLDFQKAFDTVPVKRLLVKLKSYGIKGKVVKWIESFLVDRKMRVNVQGSFSEWTNVTSGVPQGSVLGPLLFVLYVNDIPDIIKSEVRIFADDTKVWRRIKDSNDCKILQDDLTNICTWSDKWLLKLHVGKCKKMSIVRNNHTESVYSMIDSGSNKQIEEISQEKDLGVLVSNNLKPTAHCVQAVKKANSVLKTISKSFRYMSVESFHILFKTYIRPHLDYCSQIWAPFLRQDINHIERVQRRATKLVYSLRDFSYQQRLSALKITSLEDRRVRGDLIECFKILKGFENIESQNFFVLSNDEHNLRRHSMNLMKNRCQTKIRQCFFTQRVVNHWNALPEEIILADSVNSFKNKYDQWKSQRDGNNE